MHSHHDGEIWGLTLIDSKQEVFMTSGDDNKILMFDVLSKKMIQKGNVVVVPEEEDDEDNEDEDQEE